MAAGFSPPRAAVEDRRLEPGRAVLVVVGRVHERLPRLLIHAGQCLMFKHCGHESSVRYRIGLWYLDLRSCFRNHIQPGLTGITA